MSDSDDTDILLLIPPNYFLTKAEETLLEKREYEFFEKIKNKSQQLYCLCQTLESLNETNLQLAQHNSIMDPPQTTSVYKFLEANKKAELNHINSRLHVLERDAKSQFTSNYNVPNATTCPFTNAGTSDISTILNSTVRTNYDTTKNPRNSYGLVHSTPKSMQPTKDKLGNERIGNYLHDNVLLEIDNFLEEDRRFSGHWEPPKHNNCGGDSTAAALMSSNINNLGVERIHAKPPIKETAESNLISLSDIWGKGAQGDTILKGPYNALREEQMRRTHLEKTVHSLQSRLLELQQRLSVAIEVDRTKDVVLNNALLEVKSVNLELEQLRELTDKHELQQVEYKNKIESMQKELSQAVSLTAKFQDKNEKLETELANIKKETNEGINAYKQKIEDLEIKLHGAQKAEEYLNNDLNKMKDRIAKVEYQTEKLKTHNEELGNENTTLHTQKEKLQELYQKQRDRADNLETQRKALQDAVSSSTDNESSLKKKLEVQQKALKTQYQQQLEKVVAQKMREFQEQLDKTEEALKSEARDRERLIAERAVKQLELLNEKCELELNLSQEKHNEEIDLYRLQLANASKKIDELEQKLHGYKSKRADIAEKLHGVMEDQWQKALEILTSPNQASQLKERNDNETPVAESSVEQNNANAETPKITNKQKETTQTSENNLNVVKVQVQPMDRLQAYIELLLSKSPSDFDKLDQILEITAKKNNIAKANKSAKRCLNKPPWKA